MRITGILVLVCVLVLASSTTGSARLSADDPCIQSGETPVHIKTSDGVVVYGVEVGTGTTGVVLAHQYFSDHCEFMDFARELGSLGYRALAIDFRCNGLSTCGDSRHLDRDVAAGVGQLRADGATRIKLVGASMGGTAVLIAASSIRPAVDGVVSLSGPAYFRGLDAAGAVRRSQVPVRFLVSKGDRRFARDARYLMRAAAAKDKAIVRYAGRYHGSSILALPSAKPYVLQFLAR